MLALTDIEAAARNVYAAMTPTPQYAWPLLAQRAGCEVWVKHENHTPTGAFKVRGGLNLLAHADGAANRLPRASSAPRAATTARASRSRRGATASRCTIVVPQGNSRDKNARDARVRRGARRARPRLRRGARARGDARASRGPALRRPVRAASSSPAWRPTRSSCSAPRPTLDTVYVPIGCGSGICGLIAARDALGLATRDRRRRVDRRATPTRSRSAARASSKPRPRSRSPTAWRCACRCRRRWR